MQQEFRILAINPGSTSTKIGVFDGERLLMDKTIRHNSDKINEYNNVMEQYEFRKNVILETLDQEGINISKLSAVVGRGGLLRPIEGGTYEVNEAMLKDLKAGYAGEHASNLGGIIAFEIASSLNIPSYIVDPVVVDELEPLARISGIVDIERKSIFHALNQKAVSRKAAKDLGKTYEELNLIVAHLGGGISIGVHKNGKVIDVNNALNGEGPFSPERAGTVQAGELVQMCFSGDFTKDEIMKKLVGKGGLVSHLNSSDAIEVEKRIQAGDQKAQLIYDAMTYQIAKEIGAASTVLFGKVDAIILTGGLVYGKEFTAKVTERISWIADCILYPGENELQALAEGALRVLNHEEDVKTYSIREG